MFALAERFQPPGEHLGSLERFVTLRKYILTPLTPRIKVPPYIPPGIRGARGVKGELYHTDSQTAVNTDKLAINLIRSAFIRNLLYYQSHKVGGRM